MFQVTAVGVGSTDCWRELPAELTLAGVEVTAVGVGSTDYWRELPAELTLAGVEVRAVGSQSAETVTDGGASAV